MGGNMTISDVNDRISNLPELVLHHILSFLPTKTAASTCILSKRWMFLWTSIPILDFGSWFDLSPPEEFHLYANKFMDFVDRTLHLRDMHSNVQKFSLDCSGLNNHHSRINAWISFVLRRKVVELVIRNGQVPSCLFVCESLTRLELNDIMDVYLPKSICFPMLKILKLHNVYFSNGVDRLFPNCPVLEELVIRDCHREVLLISNLLISNPSLKHLTCFYPAQSVKIWTPNLVFLSYTGSLPDLEILESFSSLVDARLQGYTENEEDHGISREKVGAIKLLGELCNVKHLSFSLCTIEELYISDDSAILPMFYYLTHLKVDADILCSTDKALLNLLRNSPMLESLIFDAVFPPYLSGDDGGVSTLDTVDESLLSSLKSIEFRFLEGHRRAIGVAKFFLINATVLQTMIIDKVIHSTYFNRYSLSSRERSEIEVMEEKMKIMEEVLALPRASSSCVINLKENW